MTDEELNKRINEAKQDGFTKAIDLLKVTIAQLREDSKKYNNLMYNGGYAAALSHIEYEMGLNNQI